MAREHGATISSDGKRVAYRNTPDTIRIVEARSGKEIRTVTVNEGRIGNQFRFTDDGKNFVFTNYADVTVIDAQTGKKVGSFMGKGDISARTVISADGTLAATTSTFGNDPITIWNVKAGKALGDVTAAQNDVHELALSGDGKVLATAGRHRRLKDTDERLDHIVQIWDVASRKEKRRINADSPVTAIKLSADGTRLATELPEAKQLVVWDSATGKKVAGLARPDAFGEFTDMHYSPDGNWLAITWSTGRLDVWNVATGKPLGSSTAACERILGVGFPGNNTAIACGRHAQAIQVWEAPGAPVPEPSGHAGIVTAIRFTANGKELLTAGTDNRVIRWDAGTGKELEVVYRRRMHRIPGFERLNAEDAFFTPDARLFVMPVDGGILVVDVEAKKELAILRCKGFAPSGWRRIAVSADGATLFAIASTFDSGKTGVMACAWQIKDAKLLNELRLPVRDRREELSTAEKALKEKFGDRYPEMAKESSPAAAMNQPTSDPWTSTGHIASRVTAIDPKEKKPVFDAVTGCICKNALAVSPDGRRLAVGWNDATLMLFNLSAPKN
ncbi:MAG: WD40 repeat domain-containing protein [Gemmataceae bacterium]|nr:WD40 repeat domain-containing protein [Gemmataceae bacterium]